MNIEYACIVHVLNLQFNVVFIDNEDGGIEPSSNHSEPELEHKDARQAVLIKEFIPIDFNHFVVKELLSMGYEPEQCLQAAERFPDDITQAEEYLMDTGVKGSLFGSLGQTFEYDTTMYQPPVQRYQPPVEWYVWMYIVLTFLSYNS